MEGSLEILMSRFARSSLFLFAAFAANAHAQSDAGPHDHVAIARQFLREVYPDLTRQLYVTIRDQSTLDKSDNLPLFGIELDKPKWMPPGGLPPGVPPPVEPNICGEGCVCGNPILTGQFGFDAHGEVLMAWMGGPFLTCRLDGLLEVVSKHPDWTDTRILNEMRSSGAKFGPDRRGEFVRLLPIARLRPFLGEIEVRSVEFEARKLTWLVRLTWRDREGHVDQKPFLVFEPFEGRLIQFNRSIVARLGAQ
jgi:hypothetical protein